jgi:hypothetical protein
MKDAGKILALKRSKASRREEAVFGLSRVK